MSNIRCSKNRITHALIAGLLMCISVVVHPFGSASFSAEKAGFSLKFRDQTSPHRIFGIFAMPDERIPIEVTDPDPKSTYALSCPEGGVTTVGTARWVWRAPSRTGIFTVFVTDNGNQEIMTLNVFVMVPYGQLSGGYLNGYRIGKYPPPSAKGWAPCEPPKGFIEVTTANEETFVSPHFQLKQFLCKQNGGYPKYVVLKEKLLLKLEHVLQRVNECGFRCNTFTIMSGYRTPYYNRLIGNATYSRHLWGGAADIFIDQHPRDDMMDDLNGDGISDWRDAKVISHIIEEMYDSKPYEPFIGGLAAYKKNQCHGPFVHVDVRGTKIRWGK